MARRWLFGAMGNKMRQENEAWLGRPDEFGFLQHSAKPLVVFEQGTVDVAIMRL